MSAQAATTIGQTGDPTVGCGDGDPIVQASTAGPPTYSVPAGGGVVTSWSEKGNPTNPGTGKLIMFRPTTNASEFIVVGKSGVQTFVAGTTLSFPTRIPVQAGDLLGIRTGDTASCLLPGATGDTIRFRDDPATDPDPVDGSTQLLPSSLPNLRIDISATVEPDADRDGFGDETQDKCSTQASTQGPCVNAFSFRKLKRNKREGTAALTVELPGPGTLVLRGKGLVKQRPGRPPRPVRALAKTVSTAGHVTLKIRSKGKEKRKLNRTGKVKVKARVTYTPTGGKPNTETKRIKLIKLL